MIPYRYYLNPRTGPYISSLLCGLCVGTLVTFDFDIGNLLHIDIFNTYILRRPVPFVFSSIVVFCVVAFGFIVARANSLWRMRVQISLTLIVLLCMAQFTKLTSDPIGDVIYPLLFLVWMIDVFMDRGEGIAWTPFYFFLLALLMTVLLSYLNATRIGLVFHSLLWFSKRFVVVILLINLLRREGSLEWLLKVFLWLTILAGLFALIQEAVFLSTGQMLVIGGLTEGTSNEILQPTSTGAFFRVTGFNNTPQYFGLNLVGALVLILYLILTPELRIIRSRIVLYVAFLILGIALWLTFNRGMYASLVLAAVVTLYVCRPRLTIHITAGLLLIPLAAATIYIVKPVVIYEAVDYLQAELSMKDLLARKEFLRRSLVGTSERHPIIGGGPLYGHFYTLSAKQWPAHNVTAEIAADYGFLGLLVYCLILLWLFGRLVSAVLVTKDKHRLRLAKAVLLSFTGVVLGVQNEPFFLNMLHWMYLGLAEGVAFFVLRSSRLPLRPRMLR